MATAKMPSRLGIAPLNNDSEKILRRKNRQLSKYNASIITKAFTATVRAISTLAPWAK